MMRSSESERPTTSKPGPMLAEVAGTLILNRRGSVGHVLDMMAKTSELSGRASGCCQYDE